MKKYKVLKDFLDDQAVLHLEGNEFESVAENYADRVHFWEMLKINHFIKEIPEQPKTVWDLKKGDSCWIIYCRADGEVRIQCIQFSRQYDAERSLGLLFLTREEAEKELARYKAKVILERDTKGFKPNWNDLEQDKFVVAYDISCEYLLIYLNNNLFRGDIAFATREDAEESIKNHEKEWQCWLNIKD